MTIAREYCGESFDCLLALHACKSAKSALAFRKRFADRKLIIVLTGTDLYRDVKTSHIARRALEAASAIVVLQPEGVRAVARKLRRKVTAIVQSAALVRGPKHRHRLHFEICVIGHLRAEKDPFRTVRALRTLPPSLRIRVTQAGRALQTKYARAARRYQRKSGSRYRWLGEVSRYSARELLVSNDLMVLSSRMEGGANVLCEAIASGVPVLASRIPGNAGILGRAYPGLFSVGDTKSLARLIERAATDPPFLNSLRQRCTALQPLVSPKHERSAWASLLR